MSGKDNNEWNFGDSFPSIEIDTAYWKTLSVKDKFSYLLKLVFQEKNLGNRMNMLRFVSNSFYNVVDNFVQNKEVKEYAKIIKSSTDLLVLSSALGNMVKGKQIYKHTKNNEMARLMGFPNGNHIESDRLNITQAMADAFINMSEYHKEKYKIKVDHIENDGEKEATASSDKGSDEGVVSTIKNMKIVGTIDGDIKFGLKMKTISNEFDEEEDMTYDATCHMYYPISGMKIHPSELKEKLQKVMYELYIDKVDTRVNYVKINGVQLEICKRREIDEDITNVNIPKILKAITKTLDEQTRRGIVLVGEPGVGKTISLHKIINNFPKTLVFWVTSDSINSIAGIRNVFKIFKMFKSSIIIFDDLDSAPLTTKNEITGEFLSQLDGTSDLSGFIIATVNDPSKIHMTLINRPERIDDVYLVKLPETVKEVSDIIFNKAASKGYYYKEPVKATKSTSKAKPKRMVMDDGSGSITFDKANKAFIALCNTIIKHKFTQVQIAGLITDCHAHTDNNTITLELLKEAIQSRLDSINTSNMIATKGRLKCDYDNLSEEASANLNGRRN
jgi:ATP-dependent 26S proteasome regulatory subunit